MRLRRLRLFTLLLASILGFASTAGAQGSGEGALFLLLPVGARATAMGEATAATPPAGDAVWWNPAGIAGVIRAEVLLHHSQSIIGTGDALSFVAPFPLLGVFAISASTLNFGEQELGDGSGGGIGILIPRSVVLAGTYASPIGPWIRAGITYKLVQLRADCSGACQNVESFNASSSAIDIGVQFSRPDHLPVSVGVYLRNAGPRLQVVDTEQADALPTRVHLGVDYRVTPLEKVVPNTRLHVAVELQDRLALDDRLVKVGSELRYHERLFLRGGYLFRDGSGASVGGGIVAGNLSIDIARLMGGLSTELGEPPTFISLRFRFR
jgi:hypothetical protein